MMFLIQIIVNSNKNDITKKKNFSDFEYFILEARL